MGNKLSSLEVCHSSRSQDFGPIQRKEEALFEVCIDSVASGIAAAKGVFELYAVAVCCVLVLFISPQ